MLEIAHQRVHLLQIRDRLLGRAHMRLGDDLDQRRAGAIQIHAGQAREALVQRLAGVLFQVRARDPDALDRCRPRARCRRAAADDRQLVLADLVALGQIRIEVILAREHRAPRDARVDRQPELHRHAHRLGVEHRQHARIGQVDQVGLSVGRRAVGGRRAREDLRARRKLGMDLQPDDGFPFHQAIPRRRLRDASRSRAGSDARR